MSLFRKPKKIQLRVFSSTNDEDNEADARAAAEKPEPMDVDEMPAPPPPKISFEKRADRKDKNKDKKPVQESKAGKTKALLSFADDDEESDVFQVRKSSHSKKLMRQMDKERRKKRKEGQGDNYATSVDSRNYSTLGSSSARHGNGSERSNGAHAEHNSNSLGSTALGSKSATNASTRMLSLSNNSNDNGLKANASTLRHVSTEKCKSKNKTDCIQTEIRTDDFVLVVKKSEPEVILNGRAALCAGRDDMSDEERAPEASEEEADDGHRFSKPEHLKQMLESGSIPDAAMIHAARKRRQKAREQGDYIPIEEPKEVTTTKKGSRLAREDIEGDQSDSEERVDMNAITGVKEREERREQFYAVENDSSSEDTDNEMHEWENQQIRKGVTGAQLVSAQQESALSRFMIKNNSAKALEYAPQQQQSTSSLLQQAYATSLLERPLKCAAAKNKKAEKAMLKMEMPKQSSLRTPSEISDALRAKVTKLKELYEKHTTEMERITRELKLQKLEELDCTQRAPTAAAKYRFFQEVKCYVADLVDCLNEKVPIIDDLETRTLQHFAKHQHFLVERRRQDMRDQAKEMAEMTKPTASTSRSVAEQEQQVRRAAEREGRRTRRRCEREKNGQLSSHLDGMSSDDETADRYQEQFQNNLDELEKEAATTLNDVNEEFCQIEAILMKFRAWRLTDLGTYSDAFVSLCLPKILAPLIRLEMLSWSPMLDDYKDIETMNWYSSCMLYSYQQTETLDMLKTDPDLSLVPMIIEKVLLPKVTEIVVNCWDPLSTRQTLRLIGFCNRLSRDFPLKSNGKSLQRLFDAILDKMKLALENDVFIPIFPKQVQEAKTSFFQRQFCSGLKLFRNFLSWQGILADAALRELAIGSLLNRYLLLAMRVCNANDAIGKAYIIVNTLPTVWLQPESVTLQNLQLFIAYIRQTLEQCDANNPVFMQTCEKAKQILQRLHSL